MPAIGDGAPTFALPDTVGTIHSPDGPPATVIVFTCNHCPYALAWHDRIIGVASDYADRGVRVLAINPNDADRYPRDSLDADHEPRPGEVINVPVDKKTFKGTQTRVTLRDIHIKIDNCVGASSLRSYAVLTSSGTDTDDIVAYYGVTKTF